MNLEIASVKAPDEWALNISSALGATEYVNPPGGKEFFNKEKYEKKGIKLTFLQNMIGTYAQNKATFEAGLSIIDLLMFNSIEEVNNLIDNYELS
jgi:ABC-type sulfate transport system substrate-binding protein